MTIDDNKTITWGDLKQEALQAIVAKWVRQTIRTCFIFFLPVFFTMGGIMAWYAERVIASLDSLSISQAGMKEQISSNKEGIQRLWGKMEK